MGKIAVLKKNIFGGYFSKRQTRKKKNVITKKRKFMTDKVKEKGYNEPSSQSLFT